MPNPVLSKVCSLFIHLTLFIHQNALGLQQCELQRKAGFSLRVLFPFETEPGALFTGWFLIVFLTNKSSVLPSGVAARVPGVTQASSANAGTV